MKNHPITLYQDNQKLAETQTRRSSRAEPIEVYVEEVRPIAPSPAQVRETYIEKVRETHHHHYYGKDKDKKPEPISNEDFIAFLLIPLGLVFLFGLLIGGVLGGN